MSAGPGDGRTPPIGRASVPGLVAAAGGLGVAGVALSAAAAHTGGGNLAMTAGQFCLFHAATVLGLAAVGPVLSFPRVGLVAALLLILGTALFAGDLALAGLLGQRPFPPAAPIGGTLLLAGWGLVIVAGLAGLASPRPR